MVNYNVFRNATNYEAVGVNHRALITRTLTKYPVDYALYRELLQNSADAKATSASITFETAAAAKVSSASPVSIHEAPITKMVFENNGQVFTDADWNRLKEIAKGNPDETKIGAFGVGFYSVFELTDTPLVHSGHSVMSFHFVGDELRYSKATSEQFVDGTLIDIPFRAEGRIPDLTKFLSFATQSFALLRLRQVKLRINELDLFEVEKYAEPPRTLSMPKDLNRYSYNKMFKLVELKAEQIRLDINYLNATQMQKSDLSTAAGLFSFGRKMVSSMFTSSEDPTEVTKLVCHMKRIDAVADVWVSSSFRNKMIATVLKPPSKQVHMSMLSASKLDVDRSTLKSPLSDAVFPATFNDAKIVIGFPTKQSTGLKTHLALNQLVPTMERTAVDMSNATVKDWNSELMYAAGIMARCVYESELEAAAASAQSAELAAYTMQRFEMADSAPDVKIGQHFAAGFWRSLKVALLPTQLGIQPSSKVRLAGPNVPLSLLKHTPVVTTENVFIEQMVQVGYLQRLGVDDVARDLEHGPIDVATFEDLVKWAQTQTESLRRVLDATVVALGDKEKQTILLGQIKYYDKTEDMLPSTCLPPALIGSVATGHLEKLGWRELPVQAWVQHLATQTAKPATSFVLNEQFAVQFLTKLAFRWPRMSAAEHTAVHDILRGQACIPTQKGMQLPGQAYIKPIALFPELPIISNSLDLPLKFYKALGLRESVDMKFVLKALHGSDLKWSSEDLVGYLVEHQKQLGAEDWNVLRQGKFFEQAGSGKLVECSALFLPSVQLEQLGFSVLKWKGQPNSQAEKLLLKLRMRRAPTALELFERAASTAQLEPALKYYLQQYDANEYSAASLRDTNLRIVPTKTGRAAPRNCFYAPESELFGLEVVRGLQEYQSDRLGVRRDPPVSALVEALSKRRPTLSTAPQMFAYLSSRLSEMTSADIDLLRKLPFIPVGNTLQRPGNVFFSGPDSQLNKLFCIVEASPAAKPFLQRVGVQECPSTTQIAWKIVEDPGRVYELVGSSAQYLDLLYRLQTEWATISRDTALVGRMKVSAFLLCEQRDENNEATLLLCSASDIKIVDNIIIYNQFKHLIKACPQETALEAFYSSLGARNLSASLLERCTMGRAVEGDAHLEAHIKERLTVFLESTSKKRRVRNPNHLSLAFVSSIQLERKLAETPAIKVATTAYMLSTEPNKLYLLPEPDWFDVSSVLARHCLARPDPESVIVLELQLGSTLESLQRKGYNVSRLLKKQQETKDRELRERLEKEREERLRVEQAEAKRRQDRELQLEQQRLVGELQGARGASKAIEAAGRAPAQPTQPVAQPAALPAPAAKAPPALPSIPLPETSGGAPPMASLPETATNYLSKLFKGSKGSKGPSTLALPQRPQPQAPPQPQTALPTDIAQGQKEALESTLDRGIQCSRPWLNDTQAGNIHQDTPPPSIHVPLKCDSGRSTDLKVGAKLNDGTKIFIDRQAPPLIDAQMASAVQLSSVLNKCCEIYEVPYSTCAIFVGDLELIAYNTGGSLFFNLAVYEDRCSQGWPQEKHLDYWFTVMAHELAHNLVQEHGPSHSYFTEMYVAEKLAKLRKLN